MDKSTEDTAVNRLLGIDHAIIQAPMAGGITTAALVSEVSNAGGLGMIAGGSLAPEDLRTLIRDVRRLTDKNFGVNLFIPRDFEVTDAQIVRAYERLRPAYEAFDLEQKPITPAGPEGVREKFNAQLEVVMEEEVPVASFIFGIPEENRVKRLHEAGVITLATATTAEEAEAIETAGLNGVILQGSEAGGHRGAFLKPAEDSLVGLMSLIPGSADRVGIPVIAAGGIMDGRNIAAAKVLGAGGVQMGTAFLAAEESGAHPVHKNALTAAKDIPVVLTTLFTGRHAQAVKNTFISEFEAFEEDMVEYPVQRSLTQPVQDASKEAGKTDYAMLLAGQGKHFSRQLPARELIKKLVEESKASGFEI